MRRFWLPATLVLLAAAGLVAALVQRPGDRALATDVFLLFLGGLALGLILRETASADRLLGPSPIELAQRTATTSEGQVPELVDGDTA